MGNITQDIVLVGGLNSDDDLRLLPEGDYRHAENIRFATSEANNIGAFESIFGNEIVSNGELWNIRTLETSIIIPNTATHTCIGSCIDITTNCVYFAVHTSPFKVIISQVEYEYVQDAIYEYNKSTGAITALLKDGHETDVEATVFYDKFLNFNLDYKMNGMFVVDGMLFFNDGYNPPRKINISRAKNLTKSINTIIPFTDNYYAGNVGFVVSQANYNTLSIGDRIQIFQNRGATYSYYDGTAIIISKVIYSGNYNYVVVTNKSFLGNTTPEGGYIYKSYGGYSVPFKEAFMDRIKHPPVYPPVVKYDNDNDYKFNNVSSIQFQFAYKYVYNDNEESTLSPISKIDVYYTTLTGSIFINNDVNSNNIINIKINSGNNDVKSVKIYTRSTSESADSIPVKINCNNSDWWLVDEITKYDDNNNLLIDDDIEYIYTFRNSQNKQYGDQVDLSRPFDYVPQICGTSEIIENSRIVDGDIIEGFDNTNLDVSVEFIANPIIDGSSNHWDSAEYITSYTHDYGVYKIYLKHLTLPNESTLSEGQILVFQILPLTGSNFASESVNILLTSQMLQDYPMSVKKAIYDKFKARGYFSAGTNIWGVGEHQHATLYTDLIIDNANDDEYDLRYNKVFGYDFIETPIYGSVEWQLYNHVIKNRDKWLTRVEDKTLEHTRLSEQSDNYWYDDNLVSFYENSFNAVCPSYNKYQLVFVQRARNLWDNTTQVPVSVQKWLLDTVDFKLLGGANMINSVKSLKTNDYHEFGIVYSDRAGRTSFVNKINSDTKYLGTYFEQGLINNWYYFLPKFTINSTPPTWATNYEIVYNPYGVNEYYLQYYTKSIVVDSVTMTKISIGSEISTINSLYNQTVVEPYVWKRGDRISIITQKDGKTLLTTKQDHEIMKADANYVWIIGDITTVVGISGITPTTGEGWLYEIYRPAKTNKEIVYYSTGDKFSIENGYHKGTTQDQTSSIPAIISSTIGNCYIKRGYYLAVDGYREDSNAYDFFKSDGLDIGRPNIVNVNAKQQHLYNHIRFSGRLFTDTQINNICRNDASDIIELSSKFGTITKLTEVGYVLKALQERNLTSIYIGRTQLTNTDGSTNLSAVNTPLGTINPSESLYGTKYHKSVIRNNRSLYFLDTIQGAFIKDDNNGSAQISEQYKMNYFFTSLCKKIESGIYDVAMTSSYDIRHEEALLSVSLVSSTEGVISEYYTIAYSEIRNRFITFYTYYPEHLENLGQQLFAFKNGELWLQNHTTDYNKFFGTVFPQKVTLVANKMPKNNKVFTNNAIRTTGEWSITEIRVPATLNYAIGMKSRLKKNKFVNKEGVQYAPFMNDMTDPNYSTVTEALINGRPLRGECIEIDYYNDSTKQSVTLMFSIGMTISEHN